MQDNKKILIVIGILLIIFQLFAFIGMSRMKVGLYPSRATMPNISPSYSGSKLNIKMALFAIQAGGERFSTSFEDITFPKDEYRMPSVDQYTSAYLREALGCSRGGSFGLIVYDTILTISYFFLGIVGAVLLFLGTKPDSKNKQSENENN